MKAIELSSRDLMVGDWVKHYNGTPMQVTKITTEHFCASTGGISCWEYNNKYEPIPLTPEILEKNGFKDLCYNHHNEYIGIDDRVVLSNYKEDIITNNEWHVQVDSEDFHTIAICEITYVHELQHALKLYEIDKEIDM